LSRRDRGHNLPRRMKTNKRVAVMFRRTIGLLDESRELIHGSAQHDSPAEGQAPKTAATGLMEDESLQLRQHLLDVTRCLLTINEAEHRRIGGALQDQLLQTLIGIHIRLLALSKQVTLNGSDMNKQIASTRRLMRESWSTLQRTTRAVAAKT